MYVVAIFLKRYVLMAMGFAINPLGQYTPPYFPSLVEVLLALGILALGLLIMTLGAKVLPLEVPEEEHGEGHAACRSTRPPPSAPSRRDDPPVTANEAGTRVQAAQALRIIVIVAVALVVVLLVALAVPLVASRPRRSSSPATTCLNRRFVNLENSAHEGIGCRECHETQPVANGVCARRRLLSQLRHDRHDSTCVTSSSPRRHGRRASSATRTTGAIDARRTERIPHPAHLRVASETRNCVDCHKWTAHLETYMEKHKKMPFSGVCVVLRVPRGHQEDRPVLQLPPRACTSPANSGRRSIRRSSRPPGESACLESCHQVEQCQQCHTTGKTPSSRACPSRSA